MAIDAIAIGDVIAIGAVIAADDAIADDVVAVGSVIIGIATIGMVVVVAMDVVKLGRCCRNASKDGTPPGNPISITLPPCPMERLRLRPLTPAHLSLVLSLLLLVFSFVFVSEVGVGSTAGAPTASIPGLGQRLGLVLG